MLAALLPWSGEGEIETEMERSKGKHNTMNWQKYLFHGDTIVLLGTIDKAAFVNFRGENGVVKASVWTFCQPWQKPCRRDAEHRKFCSKKVCMVFIEILAINRSKATGDDRFRSKTQVREGPCKEKKERNCVMRSNLIALFGAGQNTEWDFFRFGDREEVGCC